MSQETRMERGGPNRRDLLGAGAAALVSLKLRQQFPALKCLAYRCRSRCAGEE